jgi:hypothetical protein
VTTANKAVLAAALAGLTSLFTDLQGADDALTFRDWVVLILAALIAGIGVYLVPNYAPGRRKEGGQVNLLYALWCLVLALAAIALLAWLL